MHIGWRLLFALAIEVGWEVLENTPMVIDHYRQQALAQGYTGDSILNSISDSVAMLLGFIFARVSPVWITVILLLAMELFVGYMIRDNLVLNITNLIHVFPWIEAWQSGA
jgi:Zn-dependent protease